MPGIFSNYRIAVLDSSFFLSEFTQEVKNGLKNIKVYVSGSFDSELEQYKLFLSREKLTILNSNLSFLTNSLSVNTFDMSSAGEKAVKLHNDIWGLISLLVSLKGNFVVITANQILMQRIILDNIPADIYDLNSNTFRNASSFAYSKVTYEFGRTSWPIPQRPDKVAKEGTTLYKNSGGTITLGEEMHSGLEGVLYRIKGQYQTIAKIFNKEELPGNKFSNLKNIAGINKRYDISFAAFPEDLLYYDSDCKIPAGFTEALVSSGENLGENPLYLGNISDCPTSKLDTRQSESIELCLKIVRQVCYLNVLGFFISDFNYSNFSIPSSNNPYVQMWDVDSFGYGKYFSEIDAGYKLSRDYNYSVKRDAIASCYDELYLFVFSILSLGDYPMSEKDGVFKYSKSDYLSRPIAQSRKKLFPTPLWNLFSDVFTRKKEPSAEALLDQLSATYQDLKKNSYKDKSYRELLSTELSNTTGQSTTTGNNGTGIAGSGSSVAYGSTTTGSSSNGGQKKSKIWIWIVAAIILIIILIAQKSNAEEDYESSTDVSPATSQQSISIDDIDFYNMSERAAIQAARASDWETKTVNVRDWSVRKGHVSNIQKEYDIKTLTLYISEGAGSEDDIAFNPAISIYSSKDNIVLHPGSHETIVISGSGDELPDSFYFSIHWQCEIETEWGDWLADGLSADLTIIGTECSSGYARIYLVDGSTDIALAYTDIFITVK